MLPYKAPSAQGRICQTGLQAIGAGRAGRVAGGGVPRREGADPDRPAGGAAQGGDAGRAVVVAHAVDDDGAQAGDGADGEGAGAALADTGHVAAPAAGAQAGRAEHGEQGLAPGQAGGDRVMLVHGGLLGVV